MKRHALKFVPLLVACGLFAWILSRTSFTGALESLRTADLPLFLAAFLLMFVQFAISTFKWTLLLRRKGIRLPFRTLYAIYLSGSFISSFLPGRYSGDLYRGWVVARKTGRAYDSAATVVLERVSGLFVLCGIGFLASLYWVATTADSGLLFPVAIALGGIVCMIVAMFSEKAKNVVAKLLTFLQLGFLVSPLTKFHKAIATYRGDRRLILQVLGLAIGFYAQAFAIIYLLMAAVGGDAPYVYVALVTPVVYLLEALPISVNGLGVRESAFILFFGRIGISNEQVMAFSLLVLLNRTLTNLSGGFFLLARNAEWRLWRNEKTATKSGIAKKRSITTNVLRLAGRYLVPRFVRSLYYCLRFKSLVSLQADIQLSKHIRIGRGSDIRPFTRIITTDATIQLGRRCGLNSFIFISAGSAPIVVGDDVRIGPHTSIVASNKSFDDRSRRISEQSKIEKGIAIGDDVWIGANVVILDGVTIGTGSVIGAGSVVTKDIPPYSVATGNPARVIRERGRRRRAIPLEMISPPLVEDRRAKAEAR